MPISRVEKILPVTGASFKALYQRVGLPNKRWWFFNSIGVCALFSLAIFMMLRAYRLLFPEILDAHMSEREGVASELFVLLHKLSAESARETEGTIREVAAKSAVDSSSTTIKDVPLIAEPELNRI